MLIMLVFSLISSSQLGIRLTGEVIIVISYLDSTKKPIFHSHLSWLKITIMTPKERPKLDSAILAHITTKSNFF